MIGLGLGNKLGRNSGILNPILALGPELWINAEDSDNIFTDGSRQWLGTGQDGLLSIASNSELQVGDIDFTFSLFVCLNASTDSDCAIFSKADDAANLEYRLWFDTASLRFKFSVSDGATTSTVTADTLGDVYADEWHHIIVYHDSTNNLIGIQIDGGAADTTAHSAGVTATASTFRVGQDAILSTGSNMMISLLGFWKRLLTSSEKTELIGDQNSYQLGLTYVRLSADLLVDLVSYWEFKEPAYNADAIDSHSSNTLTKSGTSNVIGVGGPGVLGAIAIDPIGGYRVSVSTYSTRNLQLADTRPSVFSSEKSINSFISQFRIAGAYDDFVLGKTVFSISCWIQFTGNGSGLAVSTYNKIAVAYPSATYLEIGIDVDGAAAYWRINSLARTYDLTGNTFEKDAWYHIVFTKTAAGDNGDFYINGVKQTVYTGTLGDFNSFSQIGISFGGFQFFDYRIYTTALNQSQVDELYAGSDPTGATLGAKFNFDGGLNTPSNKAQDGDCISTIISYDSNKFNFGINGQSNGSFLYRLKYGTEGSNLLNGKKCFINPNAAGAQLVIYDTYGQALTGRTATIFAVGSLNSIASFSAILSLSNNGSTSLVALATNMNGSGKMGYFDNPYYNQGLAYLQGSTVQSVDTPYIWRWVINDGSDIEMYLNGVLETNTTLSGTPQSLWAETMGYNNDLYAIHFPCLLGLGYSHAGKLRHIIVFTPKLSDSDVATVEQWLADDIGISL